MIGLISKTTILRVHIASKASFLVFGGQEVKRSPRLPVKRPGSSSGALLPHDVKFPYATFYGGSRKKKRRILRSSFFLYLFNKNSFLVKLGCS